jgi:hypothetical protein
VLARDRLDEPTAVTIEHSERARGDTIEIAMRPGGGFIGSFSRSSP